jgi:hypothetical protein
VVVVVGFTVNEPLAERDSNVPGVMAILVAPAVFQVSMLLAPATMLAGFAVKEVIVGSRVTATVAVAWAEPAAVLAVSV